MRGKLLENNYKGHSISVYLPPSYGEEEKYPCVIIQDGNVFIKMVNEIMAQVEKRWQIGEGEEAIFIFLSSKDRLLEYTPWEEKAINPKFHDFGGGGNLYLKFLTDEILPWIQSLYNIKTEKQGILGYSLSGLIAVYATTRKREKQPFSKIGSLCGSFWYPNWIEYLKCNIPNNAKFYFCYGNNEGKGKQERLSKAPDYARETIQIVRSWKGNEVVVTYDEGGHHDFMKERFYKALVWFTEWTDSQC